jgi:hypothetical protein
MIGIIVMATLVLPAQYILTWQQSHTTTALASERVTTRANISRTTAVATDTVRSRETDSNTIVQQNSAARVAGTSTTRQLLYIPVLNINLDLSKETSWLFLGGGIMILFSLATFIYLSATAPKQKLPAHWR